MFKKQLSFTFSCLLMLSIFTWTSYRVTAYEESSVDSTLEVETTEQFSVSSDSESEYSIEVQDENCNHVHNEDCGYVAPIEEISCLKNCSDINGDGLIEHRKDCTYQPAQQEVPCDKECVDIDCDGIIDHAEDCAYKPAIGEIPCNATCKDIDNDGVVDHSEDCLFQPAQEGSPCNHIHDETCYVVDDVENELGENDNIQPYEDTRFSQTVISEWNWTDDYLNLFEQSDDGIILYLTGYSKDNLLTKDKLDALLPKDILAIMDDGTSISLDITWDLSSISAEGIFEGLYKLTFELVDKNYTFEQENVQLFVYLQFTSKNNDINFIEELPSGTPPYSNHYEYGVSPSGTTINLFDYWLTAQTDSDITNPSWTMNQGINDGHTLLFGNGMKGHNPNVGNWNHYTGSSSPRTGIVSNRLVDGYPKLNVDMNQATDVNYNNRDGQESLAYLFNPNLEVKGKASYPDVKGLLQVDKDGYYYYDSSLNYAVIYPTSSGNEFTLYDLPGVKASGKSGNGQFFPFNKATSDGTNGLMNLSFSGESNINHYFGIHMSTRFIQTNNGFADEQKKIDVTYTFSGDDDVWIYIDGILVADLGGIHDAASVTINFRSGEIYINNELQDQSLGVLLNTGSATLPNDTYHTLDFFYLERGNVDSNMKLKYNLVTIPESDLIKIDQLGDPVTGAEFSLYAANEFEENGENAEPIATGVTDANGEFVFLDDNELPLTIQKLYEQYGDVGRDEESDLVLVETYTPPGYRTTGYTELYFYETKKQEVLLLSNSVWDQGSYAMAKVIATAPNSIRLLENNRVIPLMGNEAEENPLMFGVVLQKQSNGEWLPISGDPLSGWTLYPDSSWESILAAARSSRYIFQLASSGAYQVEISNLPGDIKTYYHVCLSEQDAQYTVGYYYTEADSLSLADETNTFRIDADPIDGQTKYEFDRVFAMSFYISNIKNNLIVQKVDDLGNPVNGAEFSLYPAESVAVNNGQLIINEGSNPLKLITDSIVKPIKLDGAGVFQGLSAGEYFLVESKAPKGYQLNDTPIHVLVDDTGVYADAGELNDGITVLRGAGSVVRSMLQFAADDKVNATLNGIKVALANDVNFIPATDTQSASLQWEDADWDESDESIKPSVLHLKYANSNGLLDYGLYDTSVPGTLDNLTLSTDVGWSKLLVRQCLKHNESINTTNKEDLGNQDITKLFSTTATVRVENKRTGDLKITKSVTGDLAPKDKIFTYVVTIYDGERPLSGTFVAKDYEGKEVSVTFEDGSYNFTLKHGQSITILDLPVNATYTIEETNIPGGFYPSVQVTGDDTSRVIGSTVIGTVLHCPLGVDPVIVNYTNVFDGMARVVLSGSKTIMGRYFRTGESYTFTLSSNDEETLNAIDAGIVVLPNNVEVTITSSALNSNKEMFRFESITFKKEGEYKFNIQEKLPLDLDPQIPVSDEVWYDTHISSVTVTVVKDAESGILSVSKVDYFNDDAIITEDANTTNQAAFTNRWASLLLSKEVTGNTGDRDKAFDFKFTLTDSNNDPIIGNYSYIVGTLDNLTTVEKPENNVLVLDATGSGTLKLKHGQTITLYGLPVGSKYIIQEIDSAKDGYTTTVAVGQGPENTASIISGSITGDETIQVAFVNSRNSTPITGIRLDNWPLLLCMALSFGGIVALQVLPKRRRNRKHRG